MKIVVHKDLSQGNRYQAIERVNGKNVMAFSSSHIDAIVAVLKMIFNK